jgi:hypothetical protein
LNGEPLGAIVASSRLPRGVEGLVQGLRWLGAAVAVLVAVALIVVAPAGATEYHPPKIRHCHYWPGLTEVHWNKPWLYDTYRSNSVVHGEFEWAGAIGPTLYLAYNGHENFVAATPIGSYQARAVLTLGNGIRVWTDWVNCS